MDMFCCLEAGTSASLLASEPREGAEDEPGLMGESRFASSGKGAA
jgi:hypothetical protein